MTYEVIPYEQRVGALSVTDVRSQVNLIQHVLREVMKEGQHFGVIPGTNKPTLLKAGAEKLCLTFRLDPQYEITERQDGPHLSITSKCTLWHIPSGQRFGSGMGSCSTREAKYAYRQTSVKCPVCEKEAIIKGKEEYGGGWVCFKKKGGCGAKFADGAQEIEKQPRGRVPNEDLADTYNTVLKMANKRSLVAAVLNATAASDIFTQDIEDFSEEPGRTGPSSSPPMTSSAQAEGTLKAAPEQIEAMKVALAENGVDILALLMKAQIGDISEMPASDVQNAIRWIKTQKKAA